VSSWWNATSIAVGLLVVAVGAFVSAVYLVAEAHKRGIAGLERYFRRRALAAGGAAIVFGVIALLALRADQRQMFDRIVGRSWALILLGLVALAAVFLLAVRGRVRGLRLVAGLGVAALVWAWAVAQYPYLLPFSRTSQDGAAPAVTLGWILAWFVVSLVLVVPALTMLFVLDQRADLGEDPTTSRPSGDESRTEYPSPTAAGRSSDTGSTG
jgi:cytochrome d ubiquinol oxidase subunit II